MVEIRAIGDVIHDEVDAFRDCVMTTFGSDRDDDPGGADRVRALIAPGRAWAAFDAGAIVATAASYALTVGVPGGTLAMAGLTMVTVRPTHRRRGLLRELVRLHLDRVAGAAARSGLLEGGQQLRALAPRTHLAPPRRRPATRAGSNAAPSLGVRMRAPR